MSRDWEISHRTDCSHVTADSQPIGTEIQILQRATREMATIEDLSTLLDSIASTLVEHAGATLARVFLYESDDECTICRTRKPVTVFSSNGERCLHLAATAGAKTDINDSHHLLPLHVPVAIARVALERRPLLSNDLLRDARPNAIADQERHYRELGVIAGGAFPLDFRGELLGAIGMLGRQPFDQKAFELLGIFADQAATAIKSARLFGELAHHKQRLEVENAYLQSEIRRENGFEEIVGESPALRAVLRKVRQVAPVETTVLLTGETGTGKELIARAIHGLSPRTHRAMVKVNCAAIPQGVVESELFGHEKGAFTGALQRRIGRFELADKGTLFLDEVGELTLDTQVKLLRVLQEQELERVGSTKPIKIDVRLVAATNRDLEQEVEEGRFRRDLFYRLDVFPIHIPPLRDRPSDIPLLVHAFVKQLRRKLAKPIRGVTPESMDRLARYDWPGNIRELQNVVERACVVSRAAIVDIGDALDAPGKEESVVPRIVTLDEHERMHIRRALAATNGRVHGSDGAAAMLGINASTLRSRMQKLGLSKQVS
jgi:formate hydrogenlyase transcriptional activator